MVKSGQTSKSLTKAQYSSNDATNTNGTTATLSQKSQAFEGDLSRVKSKSMLEDFRAERDGPMSGHLVTSSGNFKTRVSHPKEATVRRSSDRTNRSPTSGDQF